MTKREEFFYILQDVRLGNLSEYEATIKIHKLGVVIKMHPPELPDDVKLDGVTKECLMEHNVSYESLIEEV